METREHVVAPKKPTLTPKAIIHQNFGNRACYVVEEVKELPQTECPGLSIPQMGPCLYRCTLQLPELSVVSGTFKKKKDAEQSAAEIAIEKLGICTEAIDPTPQEAQESLVSRIAYIFSEKFVVCDHPLSGHIRATLLRKGDLCGSIPISVIAFYDAKLFSLCKCINPEVESNPFLVISYIMNATANLHQFLATSERHLWIRRLSPYPQDIIESLMKENGSQECIQVTAVHIPSSVEQSIEAVTLHISSREYYLDIIAYELGFEDASNVLISRNLGKASSETRLFFTASKSYLLDLSSKFPNGKETLYLKGSLNVRASYFAGQDITGDAILASIGYTRKSRDLFYEDVTVRLYYRMLLGKTPGGIYKLSREAMLASELPSRFTSRANWRGSLPRDILCMFCRQHRLSEPLFSFHPIKTTSGLSGSCLKVAESDENVIECVNGVSVTSPKHSDSELFKCEIKLLSRCGDLILSCSPKDCYKKQNDAIQNASLKVLSWLNMCFRSMILPFEQLYETADNFNIQIYFKNIIRDILAGQSTHNGQLNGIQCNNLVESIYMNSSCDMLGNIVHSLKIEGPYSGVCPSNGSLPCIRYSVSLAVEGENLKEVIEVCDEFEFEVGIGAVVSYVEDVVMQMSVGQCAYFSSNLLTTELIFASAGDSVKMLASLSSKDCCMEYEISLIRVAEPPEERMEQALFSPPLSKQRVEFAVQQILESHATTLIDFGCGSGSLLEALLNYPTSLKKMAGVDISQKGLSRAAKVASYIHFHITVFIFVFLEYSGWNENVQSKVRVKKECFKEWSRCRNSETWDKYKIARNETKKAVSEARAQAFDGLYQALGTRDGERSIYRLAKGRERKTRDLDQVKCVKDEEGKVLVHEKDIKERWKAYFHNLFNDGYGYDSSSLDTREEDRNYKYYRRIQKQEVKEALKRMSNGKAVGPDNIPIEVWKTLGDRGLEWLTKLFNEIMRSKRMPEEWRRSTLVPIYKNKGDIQNCANYRGIKLMSHTMKLWERVIERRLRKETQVTENQFGFMPGRSTMEAIYLLRRVMEQYRMAQQDLHLIFIDLEKAYDRVPREILWKALEKKGVRVAYIRAIQDMYDRVSTSVRTQGGESDDFPITIGLHQGSTLSPYLFTLILDVLTEQIQEIAPRCMLFADDIVLLGESREELNERLETWRRALETHGFRLSRSKSEYMECKFNKRRRVSNSEVKIGDHIIPQVTRFKYLGSVIQDDGEIEGDVNHRIQAGWMKWRKASGVLCDAKVPIKLKGKFYRTAVRPAILYGTECWAVKSQHENKVGVAEMRMLRWMCGKTRQDKIRNEAIRERVGVAPIVEKMVENRLRWFGHVERRPVDSVVRRVDQMERRQTIRGRGRPKKTIREVIKKDLELNDLDRSMVLDRALWRKLIHVADPT